MRNFAPTLPNPPAWYKPADGRILTLPPKGMPALQAGDGLGGRFTQDFSLGFHIAGFQPGDHGCMAGPGATFASLRCPGP